MTPTTQSNLVVNVVQGEGRRYHAVRLIVRELVLSHSNFFFDAIGGSPTFHDKLSETGERHLTWIEMNTSNTPVLRGQTGLGAL